MKEVVDKYELAIMSSLSIINFMCEGELIRSSYNESQMRKYFALTTYDERRIEQRINVLMAKK